MGKGGGRVQIVPQRGAFCKLFGQARKSSSVSLDHSFFFFCLETLSSLLVGGQNPLSKMTGDAARTLCKHILDLLDLVIWMILCLVLA